ncbi:hypothetical protein GCM10023311_17220 [Flaviramulus aquimarinus]|uniref:Uncharacterized protein n=2 Tax=Flaviramulus aquimarinus TaxID=1170456 RepID=A0ABP9F4H4_9FLAO
MQCEDDINIDSPNQICDETILVDQDLYDSLTASDFTFINAKIIDDCLTIEIGASGCDGNTWGFNLVDSGAVAESSPEQRYLKFQLINEEDCLAYFERTMSFNLIPLQVNGSREIILHIEDLETLLYYKY